MPTVSIVIVNKGDVGVTATLDALDPLVDDPDVEVLVVDASRGALDGVRCAHSWVRWFDYAHPTDKPRTIAEQRNIGLNEARGEVLVFLDANCLPVGDWLSRLTRPIFEGEESVVAGGVSSRGARTVHDRDETSDGSIYLSECSTMNLAVRRPVFNEVGPFDERLGFAEDVDFSWRVVEAGLRIRFEPDAAVTHDWGLAPENARRAIRYGVARTRLYRKHPSQLRRLSGPDFSVAAYALFLLFLPIALIIPWYPLLLLVSVARNRRRQPARMIAYQLCYGLGVLAEAFHVPILKGQRRRYSSS